jgi:uncharacterized membrane protein SpoIIM required for sporulation
MVSVQLLSLVPLPTSNCLLYQFDWTMFIVLFGILIIIINIIIIIIFLSFILGFVACLPPELIWDSGSYRELVGLLG